VTSVPAEPSQSRDPAREEAFEARFEAAPAVVVVMALQLAIAMVSRAEDWTLWRVPWWGWLVGIVPEAVLLAPLVFDRSRHSLERMGHRTNVTFALFGVVSLVNALLLVAVIASLISGHERSGGQLLFKSVTVWATNVITFGLWFWSIDRGGPARRLESDPPPPDFLFPQLTEPELAESGWYPRLFDYLYVSCTNAIAFSPTDTLPMTRLAKLLMLSEAGVSAFTVLLVLARAVNILT
jgi:uncharacterized membrane protein